MFDIMSECTFLLHKLTVLYLQVVSDANKNDAKAIAPNVQQMDGKAITSVQSSGHAGGASPIDIQSCLQFTS